LARVVEVFKFSGGWLNPFRVLGFADGQIPVAALRSATGYYCLRPSASICLFCVGVAGPVSGYALPPGEPVRVQESILEGLNL
jgi:hypothetical protein